MDEKKQKTPKGEEIPNDGLRVLPATCRKCGGEREYQATTDEWSAWSDFNVGRPIA